MTAVLVVGSGAREHALAWKLAQSPSIDTLYVAPGNLGTVGVAENMAIAATDVSGLVRFVVERTIDLTVIGPEAPLALGLADTLRAAGCAVVGPDRAAFQLEASKAFAKNVMHRAGIPTASYRVFDRYEDALAHSDVAEYPLVVKADGLAAGKGVFVCGDRAEARVALRGLMLDRSRGEAGRRVILEEAMEGQELSLLVLVDGERAVPLPLARDHKRLNDGDAGPNTGGMGAYAPVPLFDEAQIDQLIARVITPVITEMAAIGCPYRGILFAGLMLTAAGPMVLEFNCRLGDPETQVVLPLLADDLFPALLAVATGTLDRPLATTGQSAVGVVLATPGYPDEPRGGMPITGLEDLPPGVTVFHAGTARDGQGRVIATAGRVLTVVGVGDTLDEAASRAYAAPITFAGMQRRSDIARRALVTGRVG